jgi:signal transduction histidine kinase
MSRRPALTYAEGMIPTPAPPSRTIPMVDVVLATVLAVLLPVFTFFAAKHQPGPRHLDAWAYVLVAAAAGALVARRRYTVAVLVAVFGITFTYLALGYGNGPVWVPLLVGYYTGVAYGHRLAAAVTFLAGFGIFPWLDYWLRNRPAPSPAGLAGSVAWLLVVLGAGEVVRVGRERRVAAARIRAEEARARASEERLRIARELHDSLGHALSLISVQSGVTLNLNPDLPEPVRASLAAIKQASKDGLGELRSALAVLRTDGELAPRSPALTLARLDDLVSRTTAAGLRVRAQTDGDTRSLPFGVDVAAYRIVQEALTNVARHAGPATADVLVSYREKEVTVQVDDDGQASPAGVRPARGNGIAGMRERVAALGGELYAGPRPGGGFRVRARLPLSGTG